MSKLDQLKALGDAKRKARQKPNPFEDAARGRDPAPKRVPERSDGSVPRGPASGDGRDVEAVGLPKGPTTATNSVGNRPKSSVQDAEPVTAEAFHGSRVIGRTTSSNLVTEAKPNAATVAVMMELERGGGQVVSECPVCAEHRRKKAKAQKKWRKKAAEHGSGK